MAIYPPHILRTIKAQTNVGTMDEVSARGTGASFICGSYVDLSLAIDRSDQIESVKFRSNGCGYMIAAANALCAWLKGKSLPELHGLAEHELMSVVTEDLDGDLPRERVQCALVVFEALRQAMARYRERRVEEFQGEKALICTCLGVSEEAIVAAIERDSLTDVEQVVEACRAGSGCGSCRMLIQELVDINNAEIAEHAE